MAKSSKMEWSAETWSPLNFFRLVREHCNPLCALTTRADWSHSFLCNSCSCECNSATPVGSKKGGTTLQSLTRWKGCPHH